VRTELKDTGTVLRGLDSVVLLVIILKALGGLVVASVMQYANSIQKNFSVAISICCCVAFSILNGEYDTNLSMVVGIWFVCVSIFMYSSTPRDIEVRFRVLGGAVPVLLVLSLIIFKILLFSTTSSVVSFANNVTQVVHNFDGNTSRSPREPTIYYITGHVGTTDARIPVLPSNLSIFATNLQSMSENVKAANWTVAEVKAEGIVDDIGSTMASKQMKVYPQRYLRFLKMPEEEAEFVVWFDNKFNVNTAGVLSAVLRWDSAHAVMFHRHPFLCCGFDAEFDASMRQSRYRAQKAQYLAYADEEVAAGYKRNGEMHFQAGFIIYNLHHKKTRMFQDTWWEHIQRCGIQDQLSLYFVAQRFRDEIGIFNYSIRM
jgi:hypothetical protein